MSEGLIGRDRELAQLAGWLADALAGRGSVVFLAGEAGVGKTTLARAALGDSGADLLEGVGTQDGTAPYGPIVSVLRGLRWERAPELEVSMRSYLSVLLPELGAAPAESDRAGLF